MNASEPARQSGRPRCEHAKAAILSAARRLFETSNLRDLTIEAIAKEAGVSKATIYRWWSTKADLVMDACLGELRQYTAYERTDGEPVEIITNQMRRLIQLYNGPVGRMVSQLLAEGQYQPEICERFLSTHADDRCKSLGEMLGGEREDLIFLADLLYGPIYFRLIRRNRALDDAFADRLVAEAAKRIREWQARSIS
ncbi:MAG TPA: TetR/AcrR family transcriptional regulator [Magnetospirillum sp.]|nr:TetR/AcrR family transcriptional regulator [Magnetospirillum sp.]